MTRRPARGHRGAIGEADQAWYAISRACCSSYRQGFACFLLNLPRSISSTPATPRSLRRPPPPLSPCRLGSLYLGALNGVIVAALYMRPALESAGSRSRLRSSRPPRAEPRVLSWRSRHLPGRQSARHSACRPCHACHAALQRAGPARPEAPPERRHGKAERRTIRGERRVPQGLWLAIGLAPFVQRLQHGAERLALVRQVVLVARRMTLIEPRRRSRRSSPMS